MEFGFTEMGVAALIVLIGLSLLAAYHVHSRMGKKYLKRMLKGKLHEDYIREHSDAVINGKTVCCSCKSDKIWVQLVIRRLDRSVSEHKCKECGTFLFYSYTGFNLREI